VRILQCIPSFEGGGAEKQLGYLCESLARLGVEVQVASLRGGPNLERVLRSGATYTQLEHFGNFDPMIVGCLHRVMARWDPDIVQTWIPQMDVLGGVASWWGNYPHVISERTAYAGLPRGWRESARITIGRRASAIIANSAGGESYWRNRAPDTPRFVVNNSIPFTEIEGASPVTSTELSLTQWDELIVYLGQLIPLKNISALVPAFVSVVKVRAQARAVFIGNGPMAKEISSAVRAAGCADRVRVIPFTSNPFTWLRRANVFVSVSHFEGNPNTVLEAIAAGCPVVVSDIAAHREFLDDRSARFAQGESSEAIAAAILDALENRAVARNRATRAKERIAGRTGTTIAKKYIEVYEEILRRRETRDRPAAGEREVFRGASALMPLESWQLFRCPICGSSLDFVDAKAIQSHLASIEESPPQAGMRCGQCDECYPIRNSIPRFVADSGYSSSFGYQWNRHVRTQLDSFSDVFVSRDRLFYTSDWPSDLTGESVIEAGSGAGRFTEVLLNAGAKVYSFDYSDAVDANRENNGNHPNVTLFQASIGAIPLPPASFSKVICLGVIQHTPDPAESFRKLAHMVRPGGTLVIDTYAKDIVALFQWKYILRPITTRVDKAVLYGFIAAIVPWLIPVAGLLRRIAGRAGARLMPIVEYSHLGLNAELNREWAILDTFDMYSPAHDHPQSVSTVRRWYESEGFVDITVGRGQNGVIGRGRKV